MKPPSLKKTPPRAYLFPKAIGEAVNPAMQQAAERRGFNRQDVLLCWADIVGKDIAAVCRPARLSKPTKVNKSCVLYVTVIPGRSLEIQHLQHYLVDKINAFIGQPFVDRLAIVS